MNEMMAKLNARNGIITRERVTTFPHTDAKVVERFNTAKTPEQMRTLAPYSKRVFLPSNSPLREAGVDSFYFAKRSSGKSWLSMVDKDGKFLTKTGLASEVKEVIKAIKRFGFRF